MTNTIATGGDLAKLADRLWKAKQKLKAAQAKCAPLKETADALEQELLDAMLAAKMESLATKQATISIKRTTFAELYDDVAFFEYVRKQKAFDLVRKQPVIAACKARWEDNLEVPGVRPGTKTDLSITTRSK